MSASTRRAPPLKVLGVNTGGFSGAANPSHMSPVSFPSAGCWRLHCARGRRQPHVRRQRRRSLSGALQERPAVVREAADDRPARRLLDGELAVVQDPAGAALVRDPQQRAPAVGSELGARHRVDAPRQFRAVRADRRSRSRRRGRGSWRPPGSPGRRRRASASSPGIAARSSRGGRGSRPQDARPRRSGASCCDGVRGRESRRRRSRRRRPGRGKRYTAAASGIVSATGVSRKRPIHGL